MRKTLVSVVVAAGLLLVVGATPAEADTNTSSVSAGTLTTTTYGANLTGVTLNGTSSQTATGTATMPWVITDARGSGAQWAVSVTASVLTSAAGTVDTTARTIPVGDLTITPGTITAAVGADPVGSTLTGAALTMSGSSQALIVSTGSNKGTYNLTPTFTLTIPANAFRSNWPGVVGTGVVNPYTSTLTYTIG